MSLRIGGEIVLSLWLHSKPFKFALVHKMLPNRNCIWRLNCVEVVVDDRFRKRVLAGCVPSSRGWWQYVITHLDCVKCPPPLINSVLGKKRSQIGLMAWLHTLNVTLKLYFNPRCPPSLSQTVPKVRLKDLFDENWRAVDGSTASVSRRTAVSDYFLPHDFSSTHIDLIPWELVHIKLKNHILSEEGWNSSPRVSIRDIPRCIPRLMCWWDATIHLGCRGVGIYLTHFHLSPSAL